MEIPFGHGVSYGFSTQYLDTDRLDSFEIICDTNCHNVSTSWLFEMIIRKHPRSNMVTFPVSLMRVDYMDNPVDAIIVFKAYGEKGRIFSDAARSFCRDGMVTGDVLDGTFEWTAPLPELTNIFKEQIFVSIEIIILNCHSAKTDASETSEDSFVDILS
ncbi:hypothetical protein AVEN_127215-1 [Araneus ventricosus]|uniref:Uncharacterized protein n=1 Tax=Araneus ventricosus TaxID=182803 RepID=A0A4Y2BY33_ARAVE|nr:hypothetical protein AVEN_127215-1 [Araneus ventricosus]